MIKKEIAALSIGIIAIGIFLLARSFSSAPAAFPLLPATAGPPATVADNPGPAQPQAKDTAPTNSPIAVPVKKPTPPVQAQAPRSVPPAVVPLAAKPAVALAPSPAASARNNDDSPARSKSGKVKPGTDPTLPPSYGPTQAKVHVIVFSDFQ
jgi:hypothetical protein